MLADRVVVGLSWLFLPLLYLQGIGVRRRVPRLPEAGGPREGMVPGVGVPLRLVLIGESTVAGVGVARHEDGLAGWTARSLAEATARAVAWRVAGRNGATAADARDELLPTLAGAAFDAAVIALGVNDVLRMRTARRWAADLGSLVECLREQHGVGVIVIAPVPPMAEFPAFPQPLRAVLGARARLLDDAAAGVAGARHYRWSAVPEPVREHFCEDGVHPSSTGYARWGRELGPMLGEMLASRG